MRWAEQVAREGEGERTGVYRLMAGKTEGNRSLGKPWQRGENNIEIEGGVYWNVLAQNGDRFGSCERGVEALVSIN
jgi:hypothetical protein